MSFLSRLKSKIEENRNELIELGQASRNSVVDPTRDMKPQTTIASGKRKKQNVMNTIDLENKILELEDELAKEKKRANDLKETIQSRQERYVRREQEYRATVADYERKLNEGVSPKETRVHDSTAKTLENITKTHNEILQGLSNVQVKTMSLLKVQEVGIVKNFNTQLSEKCKELEDEKKKDVEKGEMTQKESKLHEELEANKAQIDSIDNRNKYLTQKNNELKIEFKSHDQDKKILEEQLLALRQNNEKLKKNLEMYKTSYSQPFIPPIARGKSARVRSAISRTSEKEPPNQYQTIINKLKRMIELDQKNNRAARTAYARELEGKKELESLLRQCVDDVKNHISKKKSEQRLHSSERSIEDIEKVIEILLSQERVLTLLYDKTFPPRSVMKEQFFNGSESRENFGTEEDFDIVVESDNSIQFTEI